MAAVANKASLPGRPRDAVDALAQLADWARSVLGEGVAVNFDAPGAALAQARSVNLHLAGLTGKPTVRDGRQPVQQLELGVMVTAWGPDPLQAHQDVCDLAFAAMDSAAWQVDLDAGAGLPWAALGLAPRPALALRLTLRRQTPVVQAPRVRHPLRVAALPMQVLAGQVLGPGEQPVAQARVSCPSAGRSTQTDHLGRFRLEGLPGGAPPALTVAARGVVQEFPSTALAAMAQPLVLRVDLDD